MISLWTWALPAELRSRLSISLQDVARVLQQAWSQRKLISQLYLDRIPLILACFLSKDKNKSRHQSWTNVKKTHRHTSSRTCRGRKWIVRFTLIKLSYTTVTRTYYQATIRECEARHVMMHRRYGSRDVSKLMSPLPQQLPAHSACAWLPFKYVFQYACSLTSLLKKWLRCNWLSSEW